MRLASRPSPLPLAGARRQATAHARLRATSGAGGGSSSEERPPVQGELSAEDLAVVVQWVKSAGSQDLSAEDLAVVVQWLKAVAEKEGGRAAAVPPGSSSTGSGSSSSGMSSSSAAVPVELPGTDPFPDSEPERLSAAEPLADPAAEIRRKARKLRKRGEQALSAAQATAAAAADLAATAAEDTAAAQQEVMFTAAQLADDVASDAADVAASVQAAAEAAQQQVEDALARAAAGSSGSSSSSSSSTAGSQAGGKPQGKLSAPAPPAGELSAPAPPAGELSAPQPPAGELAAPQPPAGTLQAPEQPVAALPAAGGSGGGDAAGAAEAAAAEASKQAAQVAHIKEQLVGMLASLDRGAAATDDEMDRVDALVRRLETLGGPVSLSWERPARGGPSSMALLDGRWRLLYSSGFSSGSLGGRRPGPSFGGGPFTLGQVYQDIFTDKDELDNCVDLFLRFSLAALPGMGGATPAASARLRHTFTIQGRNTIEITFTDTEVKLAGGLQGWLDSVPRFTLPSLPEWLQPPKRLRSARFDVVYLDSEMRVTRGDRGELRVFIKGMA